MDDTHRAMAAAANTAPERFGTGAPPLESGAIDHLMASANIVPAQLPRQTSWTAEKRLAAAVLSAALVEIRDHAHDPSYRRRIQEDLEWILSDDTAWPFSFRNLCDLFGLDVEWARQTVIVWKQTHRPSRASNTYECAAA